MRVFSEKISTRATRRPELEAAVKLAGEIRSSGIAVTLVVHEHQRLGRGIELAMLAEELKASDVGLGFLTRELKDGARVHSRPHPRRPRVRPPREVMIESPAPTAPAEPTAGITTLSAQTLTSTVPREFVHRAAVAEVFLIDWAPKSNTHFTVRAQWPRGHSFFVPISRHFDPMLVAETIRQAGALLAHAAFQVPLDYKFLMWNLNYTVLPEHLAIGAQPADLELEIVCDDIRRRGTRLTGLSYTAVIRLGGKTIATGSASYACTSPVAYHRLRAGRLDVGAAPLHPAPAVWPPSVNRRHSSDVVLSPTGQPRRWQLRAETDHPVLFDHYVDHIPGMVLLEAARQAVTALTPGESGLLPIGVDASFTKYVEFSSPCWITAEPLTDPTESVGGWHVRAEQDGETVFDATTTVVDPAMTMTAAMATV
ncbi:MULTISPECIES: ScbA/BarX family gamma-butyrolactone biosynthesis protein [unclassified Streptomyces]|uniref:ScbA/BarX family gamma-butyrolactone biosynthesis protein n=1 Tax=unclassified Streptomyces TaxID=2593676 RepID=UPI002365733D|nr:MULTISPECIES: ScbA/BarX family gamma-butyrolactone biosynthesis protein [unclassified Streptomyces]MDF3142879.1 ScbA/BarX family gamma-butyrolactone biosynthesis protein [Streptomyces sp. T21Q-yed]WDF39312.1 ScbA/BarX family gamma-butyrolactone biosynthesis protein [Streptomyces sp. T12]